MKNIHVIQTDKPSRLWLTKLGNLTRCHDIKPIKEALGNNVNIYITSDEEIKTGDSIFETDTNTINIVGKHYVKNELDFKIVLTTDQDLIADGVQAIDDDFLEWFVKNPSCEEVEIKMERYNITSPLSHTHGMKWKIIIPKEEPTIVDKLKEYFENTSQEQIQKDWDETCKKCEGINSPTVEEFLKAQNQYSNQEITFEKVFNEEKQAAVKDIVHQHKVLKSLSLVNLVHLRQTSNGHGEFPDGYELTEKGIQYIIEQLSKR